MIAYILDVVFTVPCASDIHTWRFLCSVVTPDEAACDRANVVMPYTAAARI